MSEPAVHPKWLRGTRARRTSVLDRPLMAGAGEVATSDEVERVGGLTGRQAALLRRYAMGENHAALALRFGVSEQTIKGHFLATYRKLGIGSDHRKAARACYLMGRWDERHGVAERGADGD